MTSDEHRDRGWWLKSAYHDQWDDLVRLAFLLCGRWEDAERAVTDAFVEVYRINPRFRTDDLVADYLRTTVVNQVRRRQGRAGLHVEERQGLPSPLDRLSQLSRIEQEVLVMLLWADLDEDETAHVLGLRRGSVENLRDKAIHTLGKQFRTEDGAAHVESWLRVALEEAASQQAPSDQLETIDERIRQVSQRGRGPSRRAVVGSALAALGVGVAAPVVWGRMHAPRRSAPAPGADETVIPDPSDEKSMSTLQKDVPVLYLGRSDGLLYREMRDLPTASDKLGTAVTAVINAAPLDSDYTSAWMGGQLNKAVVHGDVIVLDVSGAAWDAIHSREKLTAAIRQLVYTATAVVGDRNGQKSVQLLRDGSPSLPFIGVPQANFIEEGTDRCGPVWIDRPQSGQTLAATRLTIEGQVQRKVRTISYRINLAGKGDLISRGVITPGQPGHRGWRRWSVSAPVRSGDVLITIDADGTKALKLVTVS